MAKKELKGSKQNSQQGTSSKTEALIYIIKSRRIWIKHFYFWTNEIKWRNLFCLSFPLKVKKILWTLMKTSCDKHCTVISIDFVSFRENSWKKWRMNQDLKIIGLPENISLKLKTFKLLGNIASYFSNQKIWIYLRKLIWSSRTHFCVP